MNLELHDGRTRAAKKHRELVEAFRRDLCGDDLSNAELELVELAATATLRAQALKTRALNGEDIDDTITVRLLNSAARLLIELGKHRKKRTPKKSALADYLASKGKANA